ncbi:MAG: DUF1512 domain-containing protein [Methanobacteriota archaeon]
MPPFDPGQVLWMIMFFAFILIYPKYMLYKMISDMEAVARTLEAYTRDAVEIIVKTSKEKGKPEIEPKKTIENAFEFFLIPPVDLDPYGILKKIEHIIDKTEDRLEEIAGKIAPQSDPVWRANTISLVKAGIGLNNIAKIVRHYVEFVKKTGNLQIAMIVQMSLPLIKRIAKAQMKGVETIAQGKPIGDCIGPLVAANLMKTEEHYEVARDIICHETEISDREIFILKANGPGANLGKFGDGVKKLCEENKISKIITVDASLKLEGEKTGKVAEGIGAAIGDPGPEKAKMEEAALKNNIPLEAYAIKMSIEEAIAPMTKEIGESVKSALELLNESVERVPKGSKIIIVGVGNACGIGNSLQSVKDLQLPEKEEEEKEETLADKIIKTLVKPPEKPKEKK